MRKAKRQNPVKTKQIQRRYEGDLVQVGRQIGRMVETFDPLKPGALAKLTAMLNAYSKALAPWAAATGARMVAEVDHQDRRAWRAATKELSLGIRRQLQTTNAIGASVRQKVAEQVTYITSLPLDAAQRVQKLTIEAMADSRRSSEIAKEIARSGAVSEGRARLIARTEVGRTSTALTESRAQSIGSEGYIWRTVGDSDVRPSHDRMEGKFVPWNKPPTLDGLTGHAGALPNCRCYPEPVIPELLENPNARRR